VDCGVPMTEADLGFIARQLERLLTQGREARTEMRLLRGEMQIVRSSLSRLEDTIAMDVLDRLRALEAAGRGESGGVQ
jgi:hypothetical protein